MARALSERNRSSDLARAFAASTSRERGGALVTSEASSCRAASATSSAARSKAAWFALEGRVKPLNLRTNCREDARISSSVAGGLKLWSVLMLRHMTILALKTRSLAHARGAVDAEAGRRSHTADVFIKANRGYTN